MGKYANQVTIVSAPRLKKDKDHLYTKLNLDALQQAMKDLKGDSGLKMYLYMVKNREDYEFGLSLADCVNNWGLSKNSYYRGIEELKEKGYLVEIIENAKYMFYELPQVRTYNKEKLPSIREAAVSENARHLEDDVVELGDGEIYRVLPF